MLPCRMSQVQLHSNVTLSLQTLHFSCMHVFATLMRFSDVVTRIDNSGVNRVPFAVIISQNLSTAQIDVGSNSSTKQPLLEMSRSVSVCGLKGVCIVESVFLIYEIYCGSLLVY